MGTEKTYQEKAKTILHLVYTDHHKVIKSGGRPIGRVGGICRRRRRSGGRSRSNSRGAGVGGGDSFPATRLML